VVESPVSPADQLIRATIQRYQVTFNSGDREAWLALFTDDAAVEDPVGSSKREGPEGLAEFWDEVHKRTAGGPVGDVRMVQGPAICGLEAAWAFQLRIPLGDSSVVVEIIDLGEFDEDGRIRRIRAFWNESTVRMEKD
jgi:steroid delta-isomerase